MPKKHYHLLAGQAGCIPDRNYVYTNKADAQAGMVDVKRQEIDAWHCGDPKWGIPRPRFIGTARDGFYIVQNIPGFDYVQIVECEFPECLEWEG